MTNDQLNPALERILWQVDKPARYIGNEINMVQKEITPDTVRFAFCFPDVYEVGMSHLGLQILYYFLNRRADVYCERAFAPWPDMERAMRENGLPMFALETFDPLCGFDFVGFTLQYEMSYTNIVNMLDLAGIPLWAKDRGDGDPIVAAGGPCAYNPEPLADMVDFFYLGEGEAKLDEVLDLYKAHRARFGRTNRAAFLESLLNVEGIYVPRFYDVDYYEDGRIRAFQPNHPQAPFPVRKVIVPVLDGVFYPDRQLVPVIEAVHDRATIEVFRGCLRGCRFCQAGYVYRPVREKEPETLLCQAESLLRSTGHEEISLVSLSTGDYSAFPALANGLIDAHKGDQVNISLPSLRIDGFSLELMGKVQEVRRSSLTFAPEAGTQRLRDVINKGITEAEILSGCRLAFEGGWNRVKLYFMVGLPTETEEDLEGIARLTQDIVEQYYTLPKEARRTPPSVVLSTSCFVPKPFTPFQWAAQDSYEVFMEKQRFVKRCFTKKQVRYNYHDAKLSVMEGAVSRGDRRLGAAIAAAWRLGARFDGWTEHFRYELWVQAFAEAGLDIGFYAARQREKEEILTWDFIDIGVRKEFFWSEWEKARQGQVTPNCRQQCAGCGAVCFKAGVCVDI